MPRKPAKESVKAAAARAEKRAKGEDIDEPKVPINPPILEVADVAKPAPTDAADSEQEKKPEVNLGGRPTKYRPEFALMAAALCRRAATDMEIAADIGISVATLYRWSNQHQEFCEALRVHKGSYDDRVERSLAQRAVGYSYETEKVFQFQGEIVRAKVVEHVPPDIGAAKLWLTNRRPKDWQDISKREIGNPGDFDSMSDEELTNHVEKQYQEIAKLKKTRGGSSKTEH